MLHRVDTIRDFQALPVSLQYAIRYSGHNRQKRKVMLHKAVADAIITKAISVDLGVDILKTNRAYGPQGKQVIADAVAKL